MGNTMCCTNQTQAKGQLGQLTIGQPVMSTIQSYLRSHPTIKEVLEHNGLGDQRIMLKKNPGILNPKEYVTSEGIYIGEPFDQNTRKGFGVLLSDNQYFQGQWQANAKNGTGILISDDGTYYSGGWKDNVADGHGRHYQSVSKTFYEGEWKDGLKNGKGLQKYQDGSVYEGEFSNGAKNGKGKLIYGNGTVYEGEFRDNVIEGLGKFFGKNHTYDGEWKEGKMHGTGKSQWRNAKNQVIGKYVGEYRNGIKEGFGQYTDSKGVTYKAIWTDGQINEKGPVVTQNLRSSIVQQYRISNNR